MYLLYMNGNMKRLFLFFLLGFSVLSIAYSQSKDNLYKTIPVVRYIPDAFLPAIDGSFIHSIESLNIYIPNEDTLYVQYRFGKLRDYDSEFFTVNHINTKPFFTPDSVFLVSFQNEAINVPYLPIYRVYGIKKDGKYLFGLTDGGAQLYPFKKMLEVRYGSVEKFMEIYKGYINDQLLSLNEKDCGISIYSDDKDEMVSFLKNDYLIHERYNPTDTMNVVNRFISLVSSYTLLKEDQEKLIRRELMREIRREPDAHPKELKVSAFSFGDIVVYEVDVYYVLYHALPRQQFEEVRRGIINQNKQRLQYISELKLYKGLGIPFVTYDTLIKETADALLGGK